MKVVFAIIGLIIAIALGAVPALYVIGPWILVAKQMGH